MTQAKPVDRCLSYNPGGRLENLWDVGFVGCRTVKWELGRQLYFCKVVFGFFPQLGTSGSSKHLASFHINAGYFCLGRLYDLYFPTI